MKKFIFLHFGFEKPTPKIMEAWHAWFRSISDKQVDQGGLSGGREISKSGTKDPPWNMESITGYNIIEAESLDAVLANSAVAPDVNRRAFKSGAILRRVRFTPVNRER